METLPPETPASELRVSPAKRLISSIARDQAALPDRLRQRILRRRLRLVILMVLIFGATAVVVVAATIPRFHIEQMAAGAPVRWDPCAPINVVVDWRRAPAGARQTLTDVLADTSRASGITLRYVGSTSEPARISRALHDPQRYPNATWSPVLVSFTDAWIDGSGAGQPLPWGTWGQARVRSVAAGRAGQRRYVTGTVVINARRLWTGPGVVPLELVLHHEFGHVLGLGHVKSGSDLMHGVPADGSGTNWQRGDSAGLRAVGRGANECAQ